MKKLITIALVLSTIPTIFAQKKWTLSQCIEKSLTDNLEVIQNKLNIEKSELELESTKSRFLPSVNATTSSNLNFGSTFNPVTNNRIATSILGGSLRLNSSIPIFNGFRNLNNYELAKSGISIAKTNLAIIQNDLSLNIINAYLNILFTKENYAASKRQVAIGKQQIAIAKQKLESGTISQTELLNIQSAISSDLQRELDTENSLQKALLQLQQIIQINDKTFDIEDINEDKIEETLMNEEAIYKKAVKDQALIKKEKLNITRTELAIKNAKAGYYPIISAGANIGTNYGHQFELPNNTKNPKFINQLDDNLGYGIGLNVNIPIFSGFNNDINLKKSRIQNRLAITQLKQQKLRLKQTISKAVMETKLSLKRFVYTKENLVLQKQAFENANTAYKYGAMTLFEFDKIKNNFINIESALIRAKYDYIFKTKVLLFYANNKLPVN